jgi:hypothetical protein
LKNKCGPEIIDDSTFLETKKYFIIVNNAESDTFINDIFPVYCEIAKLSSIKDTIIYLEHIGNSKYNLDTIIPNYSTNFILIDTTNQRRFVFNGLIKTYRTTKKIIPKNATKQFALVIITKAIISGKALYDNMKKKLAYNPNHVIDQYLDKLKLMIDDFERFKTFVLAEREDYIYPKNNDFTQAGIEAFNYYDFINNIITDSFYNPHLIKVGKFNTGEYILNDSSRKYLTEIIDSLCSKINTDLSRIGKISTIKFNLSIFGYADEQEIHEPLSTYLKKNLNDSCLNEDIDSCLNRLLSKLRAKETYEFLLINIKKRFLSCNLLFNSDEEYLRYVNGKGLTLPPNVNCPIKDCPERRIVSVSLAYNIIL